MMLEDQPPPRDIVLDYHCFKSHPLVKQTVKVEEPQSLAETDLVSSSMHVITSASLVVTSALLVVTRS